MSNQTPKIKKIYNTAKNGEFDDSADLMAIGLIVDNTNAGEEVEALRMIMNIIDKEG